MRIRFISSCVVLLMAPLVASAAPNWEIDESRLPPGLSKEKAISILEEIDRKSASERKREKDLQLRRAEPAQRMAQKYGSRILQAIESDPDLRALRDRLEAGFRDLGNPEMSEGAREARHRQMLPDMESLRRRSLDKAGIDEAAMAREIGGQMNGGVAARSADAEALQQEGSGFAYVAPDLDLDIAEPGVTTRGTTTRALGDPWPHPEQETEIGSGGRVDTIRGYYLAYGSAMGAGFGTNRRGLAHFLTVPAGTRSIRVTAQLPQTKYYNYAWAIPGAAHTRTVSRIEVWDGSNRRLCQVAKVHADVWVVLAWGLSRSGEHNVPLDCTFDSPGAGRDIVFKFVSDVYVNAWGGAHANGSVRGEPLNVRVDLHN